MAKYILRRLLSSVTAIFFVVTATFFLMHAIPGGPFASDKKLPEVILKNINAKYHLNDPVLVQYKDYLGSLLHGDLGPSFKIEHQTVNDIIRETFPVSAQLGVLAIAFALIVGLTAGIIAALHHNKKEDYMAMLFATLSFAVPSFILAAFLQYIFAYKLRWVLPALWGSPSQAILPTLALAALPTAVVARFMRSSMLEVLQQDYIKTAKAKGLSQRVVIYRHAIRNAILPVITYLGPLVAGIFTGSFVIEHMFAIPGLGKYFVNSISSRDYTLTLGVTVFYSVFLVFMNLIVDVAYAYIDPRIKLDGGKE